MLVYWCLLLIFIVGALATREGVQSRASAPALTIAWLILTVVIGFRDQVGGDWGTYQKIFRRAALFDLGPVMEIGDPAYQFLNWSVQQLQWPFWMVNVVCAAVFAIGLVRFSSVQRSPWLALVISIPYLVIVVAMGYTRQAVAIGIVMLGLAAVQRGASVIRFGFYVLVAALFHKTAVIAILLVALTGKRNKVINLMIVAASAVLLYDSVLQSSMDILMKNYVEAKYSSQGALIRLILCIIPAGIFFIFRKRLTFNYQEMLIWRNASVASFIALLAFMASPSSTAVDRIALYLLPLQLAVMAQMPRVTNSENLAKTAVVAYALLIQFTWLNYASNAYYWLPYRSYIW